MNKLYARLKGGIKEYRLIFDEPDMPDYDFFPFPDVTTAQQYAPLDVDSEKGAWVFVELDAEQAEEMVEPYLDPLRGDIESILAVDYQSADVVYRVSGDKVVFKKIGSAMRIHENGKQVISFTDKGATIERMSFGLDFNGVPDAFYDQNTKRLYFTTFARVRPLFKGIDVFYQDVTMDEKEAFLENSLFAVGDFNVNYLSLNDTKKLAAINESQRYNFADEAVQQKIIEYALNYPSAGVGVNDDRRIIINSRKDFSATIKLLEQKFFTSEITGEKFEASKTKKMKK